MVKKKESKIYFYLIDRSICCNININLSQLEYGVEMNKIKCYSPTCKLPVFVTRKDDPSIGYCMAHGMEYAQMMESAK